MIPFRPALYASEASGGMESVRIERAREDREMQISTSPKRPEPAHSHDASTNLYIQRPRFETVPLQVAEK